jgi:hypothetical protein
MKLKATLLFCLISAGIYAQNTVCFTIETNPNSSDPALGVFTKYVNVLDCFGIYAEASISDDKVLHAAAVAAELLDNDEDGIVDDPQIKTQLQNYSALMPLFMTDGSTAMNTFDSNYTEDGVSAVLFNDEIDPTQTGHWGDDASVEEILHTINHVGHTNVYPAAFSLPANSSLMSAAMDVARAGQFLTVPNSYPAAAWYHYDDTTCDYECMMIEYMYWSIVSWMGILEDAATCAGIANEWEPCSPSLFQTTDTLMYNLITDPAYKLPQLAPDGNYCPTASGVETISPRGTLHLWPNPIEDHVLISAPGFPSGEVTVRNVLGQVVKTTNMVHGTARLSTSEFDKGLYFVSFGTDTIQLIK